jgi:hypothetical protein
MYAVDYAALIIGIWKKLEEYCARARFSKGLNLLAIVGGPAGI